MKYYVNPNVASTERVFPMQGRREYGRYDMNENPAGLPGEFVESVLSEVTPDFLATYPEPAAFESSFASFVGVEPANVMATNGSDMAIRYLLETFGEPGKDVVTADPTFEMYRINCSLLGLNHVAVPYENDLSFDIGKMLDAITESTRIVALLNPNNPVGNVYTEEEVQSVIDRCGEVGAIVIIDEAYHYFCPTTFLPLAMGAENVVVLRTFSKLFSIAACRIGVIVGREGIVSQVRKSKLTFDVNSVALLFAERLLDRPEILEHLIEAQAEGKSYAISELEKRGYDCLDCAGNFFFIRTRSDARLVAERLREEKKILVHGYDRPPLAGMLRVSTGDRRSMEPFLDAFLAVDR